MKIKSFLYFRLQFLLVFSLVSFNTYAQLKPVPAWVKDIGGTGESKVAGVAVDKFDNVYVAGNFRNTVTIDLSGTSNPITLSSNGDYDVFITKYTSDGKVIWAKSFGGSNLDQLNNITVDAESNVILAGQFNSPNMDCDPGPGTFNLSNNGDNDAFIVKLDKNGNFRWAKDVGGSETEFGHVVAADNLGNIIFVGSFSSAIIASSTTLVNQGDKDGFLIKYDKNGNVIWATSFGSSGTDEIRHVITDKNKNIIIMGYFENAINLNPRGVPSNITGGAHSYFVAKYSENGLLLWANKVDGPDVVVSSLAIGPQNDVYLTGGYSSSIKLLSRSLNPSVVTLSGRSLFVGKYNSVGNALWVYGINGTSETLYSYYITADLDDNIYIGGYFDSTLDFNGNTSTTTLTSHGVRDTFFAKYKGSGQYVWAFNFGSQCSQNFGHKIAVDSKKNILLGGAFCNTVDFNPNNCNLNLTAKDYNSDGYISKYNQIEIVTDANITSFEFPEQYSPALINKAQKKIIIRVKPNTDLTKLIPKIETDIGILNPLSGVVGDFSKPKTYKISSNCIDYNWLVTVVLAQSQSISICASEKTKLIGDTDYSQNNVAYLWQIKDLNGNWIAAKGNYREAGYELDGYGNNTNSKITLNFRRQITLNGTKSSDSETAVTINPQINNNIISSPEAVPCAGPAQISIDGSIPQAGENATITYQWQQSEDAEQWTDIANEKNKDLASISINKTVYFRRLTSSGDCVSPSNSLKIQINPQPTIASAGENKTLCGDLTATLNGNSASDKEVGSWSVIAPADYNPFDQNNIHNPKAIIANMPQDTPIVLQWEISNNNCQTSTKANVALISYHNISVQAPTSLTIDFGKEVNLNVVTDLTATDRYTFEWSPKVGLDNTNVLSPNASPAENTVYSLKINYGQSCSKVVTIKVVVLNTIKIPSTFSPNGDGINDLWEIKNLGNYSGSKVSIYNRYGAIVYQATNYVAPWNGTRNGKALPFGVYYYVISLKDNKKSIFSGSVTIMH
ncbi:gliding motility-associated C-terminal domain-containing protein [Pedobacter sp. UYP30]|uniref:T9SS type B sorting domain-containing protein n=1 Tax=Pedobacter sp. UYP30 TaxID=1756400 RepID=UPI00339954EB